MGAVIRGATPHFDYVSANTAGGIAQTSLKHGIPVIFGVLTTDTVGRLLEGVQEKPAIKVGIVQWLLLKWQVGSKIILRVIMNIPIGNFIIIDYFAAIIIFVVAFSIYIPSVTMPLINDEAAFIKRNEAKSFNEYVHLFDKKDYDGAYYRPLPNFLSGIINGISPFNVTLNRLMNMVFHAFNAVLLYFFVFYLFDKKKIT